MNKPLTQLSLALALLLTPLANTLAMEIEGIALPETYTTPTEHQLILNGVGVRKKFGIKLYVGSLYLPAKTNDEQSILTSNHPVALQLDIISSRINSENMTQATRDGFQQSTDGNPAPFAKEIERFIEAFSAPIVKGDRFNICYIPDTGITIGKNGKDVASIADTPGFKAALYGIWIGEKPAQKSLKMGMLGSK